MNNLIISISREYGSGGRNIGEKVAKLLNIPCYDKLLIQQSAKELGFSIDEVIKDEEKPIGLGQMVSGNLFADTIALTQNFYSEKQNVFEAERSTILELAKKGSSVIIGRCSSSILRQEGFNALSCFIYGDIEDEICRVASRNDISEKEAARKIEKINRMRKRYFDFYSSSTWGETKSYDLLLSSSRLGIDGCAETIKNAAMSLMGEKDE